jgi:magnesium chelatase family protein
MPETAVRESKDRVRGALISSGFHFPLERIIANLAPADMRKTGGRFDLAIALGILVASRQLPADGLNSYEFFAELALNGELRPVPGILSAAIKARAAGRAMVVACANADEAALVHDRVYAAGSLPELTAHLKKRELIEPGVRVEPRALASAMPDLADVCGQRHAKHALETAAAGGHNLLFMGPPGTGKSMLAARLPGILPPMTEAEALETATIDSVLGVPLDLDQWFVRPFRAPHHTASAAALVGGGSEPRPGEISRAHNGVLFLDELPEFPRHVLEVLREPLEAGRITISRARRQDDFPAAFQLVAAMNPCPCGYLGDPRGDCSCSAEKVKSYRGRISGPLLDRIDLHIEVGRPPHELLRGKRSDLEGSAGVQQRVVRARERQLRRQQCCNARLTGKLLGRVCDLQEPGWQLLDTAAEKFGLSVRSYQRILRVARTVADLAQAESIASAHVAEALAMRGLKAGNVGNAN